MQNELRTDYFTDRKVIIAVGRGKRPTDIKHAPAVEGDTRQGCYFCPGNEASTPPEIMRVEEAGTWVIRVFPNKFPAVTPEGGEESPKLIAAYGRHEVVAETPDHDQTVADLSPQRIAQVLDVYSKRVDALLADGKAKYVMVFKNHGKAAGASLAHSHTQIISLPVVPPLVLAEAEGAARYSDARGTCPLCDAWKAEVKGPRAIWEDDRAAAFAPYASRSPLEAWLMPKRHVMGLKDLDAAETLSLAFGLKHILARLKGGLADPPYNMYLHMSPGGGGLHMHFEVLPRLSTWAGFELGSDIIINTMAPETAAEFYRSR
jgi:UDPglucose--hexose-1-phosphate uridylyltransferase